MSNETILEEEFICDITDQRLGSCECGNPDCNAIRFYKSGDKAGYFIDYDPDGNLGTNIFIRVDMHPSIIKQQGIVPVVFNGMCKTNMDFAKVLSMVIR